MSSYVVQFRCNCYGFSVKTFHLDQFMWHKYLSSGNEYFSNFNPHKLPTLYKSVEFLSLQDLLY